LVAAAGAALGIAAQAFLVVAIICYVMPFFGLELFNMAGQVVAFNLPARGGQRSGGQGNVSPGTRAYSRLKSHRSASPHLR
jgi:hypothetical protein